MYNCSKCQDEVEGKETAVTFSNGTKHIEVRCEKCGAFIKYVSYKHPKDYLFYFGKYRGRKMAEVAKEDRGYMEWIVTQSDLPDKIKNKVEEVLMILEEI